MPYSKAIIFKVGLYEKTLFDLGYDMFLLPPAEKKLQRYCSLLDLLNTINVFINITDSLIQNVSFHTFPISNCCGFTPINK